MRTILWALLVSLGVALAAVTTGSGAPVNGVVIGDATNSVLAVDQVHCKKYPHRHKNADPHGFGFGCGKKSAKRSKSKSDDAPK